MSRVRLADMAVLRSYAQAVHTMTDTCLTALADDAHDVPSDVPSDWPSDGPGDVPSDGLSERLLSALLLTMAMRHGEIACLLSTAWRTVSN